MGCRVPCSGPNPATCPEAWGTVRLSEPQFLKLNVALPSRVAGQSGGPGGPGAVATVLVETKPPRASWLPQETHHGAPPDSLQCGTRVFLAPGSVGC